MSAWAASRSNDCNTDPFKMASGLRSDIASKHWPFGFLLALLGALVIVWAPVAAASTGYSDGQSPSGLTSYELPDGTRLVICLGGRIKPDGKKAGPHCPFCTQTKCFGLDPHTPETGSAYTVRIFSKRLFCSDAHFGHRFCFLKAPRAPPFVRACTERSYHPLS